MLGVIVNVITVLVGSAIGLLFKKGIPERVSKAAMAELAVSVRAPPVADEARKGKAQRSKSCERTASKRFWVPQESRETRLPYHKTS